MSIVYVATCHAQTDVEVDYNLYVGNYLDAAYFAASEEIKNNPNAVSVRIVEWDIVSQKSLLVETIYK